ncbi:MAG: ABC transporter ATP-binding protein, partial [Lachnospiraceae bacterium]|nr:ABC transporter ATP-binding protein [Lachnospiraceae bacterium]
MLKTLLGQVGEYKKASLLTPLFTALEVLMEVLIPFITASIIDKGIEAGNLQQIYLYGGLMLVSSMVMCLVINRQLSLIFFAAILVLAAILILIMNRTTKLFDLVFQKYDDLNASVQENVTAIRVVKAFVREEYENSKFI